MVECVAGSGLSISDGALTLDPAVASPTLLLDKQTEGTTRRFGATTNPGSFTETSTSYTAANDTGRTLAMMVVMYVGQSAVALSGTNQGRILINAGWSTGTVTMRNLWRHTANFDMGTQSDWLSTWQLFTQMDVTSTATSLIIPPSSGLPILEPGEEMSVQAQIRWTSDRWNSHAVGYDSHDYADFPFTRVWALGFPSD